MNGKSHNTPAEWVDPDDAPELTAEFFEKGTPMIGGKQVTFEEFARAAKEAVPINKIPITIHVDADLLAAFRATGEGWQNRMNDALRDWLKSNPL
jgi:uncharacterized protein (DUF4415 family)